MTIAMTNETSVSSMASSAPLQYGWEESATQKTCVSKLASSYFTSPVGMLYFFASVTSSPLPLSCLSAAAIFVPTASPLR
jgi:hypothetical protein